VSLPPKIVPTRYVQEVVRRDADLTALRRSMLAAGWRRLDALFPDEGYASMGVLDALGDALGDGRAVYEAGAGSRRSALPDVGKNRSAAT